ncbi:MAG: alginate lyase family protein [Beijerinckiaceae bacterium]
MSGLSLDAQLLAEIDLSKPELSFIGAIRSAKGDAAAVDALLSHLTSKPAPGGLDSPLDTSHGKTDRAAADAAVAGRFTFQGATDDCPGLADGGFDWRHPGPNNDREWAWFLNRHMYFRALARAHAETGDPRYAAAFDRQLADWIRQNPRPSEDTMDAPWRVMEAGTRMLQSWPQAFYSFRAAPEFTRETRVRMLLSVVDHGKQLIAFHRHHHNHAIKEMAGLATAALAWPELKDAKAWYAYAMQVLDRELDWQVYPDGCHRELTSGYHITVMNYVDSAIVLADACGAAVPERMRQTIAAMVDYLAATIDPGGFAPLNNDSDLVDVRPMLKAYGTRWVRADWLAAADFAPSESRIFPHAGQIVMRHGAGEEAFMAFLDVGPEGTARTHNHADKLHLSVHAHGRPLLVDAGRATYVDNPLRRHIMEETSHNVVSFPGLTRREDVLVWDRPLQDGAAHLRPAADIALGRFLAGYRESDGIFRLERLVIRREDWLLVIDSIAPDMPRMIETLWHFHPDCAVELATDEIVTTDPDLGNIRLRQIAGPTIAMETRRGRMEPSPQGWYSPRYNTTLPATAVVCAADVKGPTPVAWLIETGRNTPPRRAATAVVGPEALAVTVDDTRITVAISPARAISAVTFSAGAGAAFHQGF